MGRFSIAWETEGEVLTASLLKTVDGKTRRFKRLTSIREAALNDPQELSRFWYRVDVSLDLVPRRVLPKTARQEVSQEIAARVRRPTFAELGIKRV